ncbi:BTB/POZ domain-containing protein 6-like [Gordionus sp. m RMFG-2023]|uniref:BTB/POZ domain-containing protein 6-like n=1 Tax=Gordionus sp. m RMFG-2023 TaxID=3053472 RepID=UPI0031FC314F
MVYGRYNIGDSLYQNMYMSDVSFEVKGEIINAHKFILSFKSKTFYNMFHGGVELKISYIKIEDMSKNVLEIILKYIYTNDISFYSLDVNQLIEILYGAKKYMLEDLIKECVERFSSYSQDREKDVLQLYLVSSIHPEINVDHCLNILKKKEEFVFLSKSFLNASVDLIRKFITSLPDRNSSTKQMTQFLIRWARNECDKCQISDNSNNIIQKLKDNKFDFFSYILDFNSEDVISVVRERKLMEDTEILEIAIRNINKVPANF